jgi:hypothetical protein
MFNIQKHLRHAVLALGLAAASLTAGASVLPTYHIGAADTATSDIAAMDLVFNSINGAAPVTAYLSHFTGTPLVELDRQGDVSEKGGVYSIGNPGSYNDLYLEVDGPFGFNLNFSDDFIGFNNIENNNGLFSVVLYNSFGDIIGNPGGELQFSVTNTGVDPSPASIKSSLLRLTEVTAVDVPEPADWMLMLTGLVFVVTMTRRNGRANARRLAAAQA